MYTSESYIAINISHMDGVHSQVHFQMLKLYFRRCKKSLNKIN